MLGSVFLGAVTLHRVKLVGAVGLFIWWISVFYTEKVREDLPRPFSQSVNSREWTARSTPYGPISVLLKMETVTEDATKTLRSQTASCMNITAELSNLHPGHKHFQSIQKEGTQSSFSEDLHLLIMITKLKLEKKYILLLNLQSFL